MDVLAQAQASGDPLATDVLTQQRRSMISLLEGLNSPEGARPSLVDGVTLVRSSRNTAPVPVLYEPCIVIVAQGTKRFHLPDRIVTYDARNYLLLTIPAPAGCETVVSQHGPFLAVAIRINLTLVSELLIEMGAAARPSRSYRFDEWVSSPALTPQLTSVAIRLLECLSSPSDAKILGPLLVRELTYRVLCGAEGGALQDLLQANAAQAQIHRILHTIHTSYSAPLDITFLARQAGMSTSALHFHFKGVTGTSPVQYLKTVRLHKARTLMAQDAVRPSVAAERVGYDSPSQFSREFKRLFGAPPSEEAHKLRANFGLSA